MVDNGSLGVCDLAIQYGCKYWMEDRCRAYSPNGVAFRVRNLYCPLGNLPPKALATQVAHARIGQQKQKKEKRY